jgi:hypothetical protein
MSIMVPVLVLVGLCATAKTPVGNLALASRLRGAESCAHTRRARSMRMAMSTTSIRLSTTRRRCTRLPSFTLGAGTASEQGCASDAAMFRLTSRIPWASIPTHTFPVFP